MADCCSSSMPDLRALASRRALCRAVERSLLHARAARCDACMFLAYSPAARTASSAVAIQEIQVIERLGRYQVRELVGEGAMASVYKAYDPDINRTIAVKLLKAQLRDDDEY